MSLIAVTDIVFSLDEFWAKSNLNTLRNLASVNKELRASVMGTPVDKKGKKTPQKKPPFVDRALKIMIQSNPTVMNHWKLTILQARCMFALKVPTMTQHCSLLELTDPCYVNDYEVELVRNDTSHQQRKHIRFIDAYQLAVNSPGGLKEAMRRRHEAETKALKAARDIMTNYAATLQSMGDCLMDTIEKFEEDLVQLRKGATGKKRVPGETELHRKIRVLNWLYDDAGYADSRAFLLGHSIKTKNLSEIIHRTKEVKISKERIFNRYRTHSVMCPELMLTNILP